MVGSRVKTLSSQGHRKGINAERSGLWNEYCRVIGEIQPQFAIVENVIGLLQGGQGRWFGRVLGDLAEIGYDAEWHCIPAAYIGAPHFRDRVWIVAYSKCRRRSSFATHFKKIVDSSVAIRCCWASSTRKRPYLATELYRFRNGDIRGKYDGISEELDSIKALGNAIVPPMAEVLGRAIIAWSHEAE